MLNEIVSKLNEQERKIFYFAAVVVLLALTDRLFFGPVWEKVQAIQTEVKNEEVRIERDLRFLSYTDRINKEHSTFNQYFVRETEDADVINAEFLRILERLANRAKVSLIKSNPTETKNDKLFTEYYASLDCTGPLEDVINFMYMINSSEDLLKIVSFNMAPKRGIATDVTVSMTISKLIMPPGKSQ